MFFIFVFSPSPVELDYLSVRVMSFKMNDLRLVIYSEKKIKKNVDRIRGHSRFHGVTAKCKTYLLFT